MADFEHLIFSARRLHESEAAAAHAAVPKQAKIPTPSSDCEGPLLSACCERGGTARVILVSALPSLLARPRRCSQAGRNWLKLTQSRFQEDVPKGREVVIRSNPLRASSLSAPMASGADDLLKKLKSVRSAPQNKLASDLKCERVGSNITLLSYRSNTPDLLGALSGREEQARLGTGASRFGKFGSVGPTSGAGMVRTTSAELKSSGKHLWSLSSLLLLVTTDSTPFIYRRPLAHHASLSDLVPRQALVPAPCRPIVSSSPATFRAHASQRSNPKPPFHDEPQCSSSNGTRSSCE